MNWAFFLVRFVIIVGIFSLFFFSQRFWHRAIWRSTANFRSQWLRVAARLLWLTRQHLNPLYALWTTLVETAQTEGRIKSMVPPYHVSQIIVGASYQFMASRVRMREAYGIDVTSKDLRERHAEAVLDILFTGLLTVPSGTK